jgi:hypothetical protein
MEIRQSRPAAWTKLLVMTVLIELLVWPMFHCKSPTSPNNEGEADILVYSKVSEVLDVYMDGEFQFSITYKNYKEIDNVSLETHLLEAKIKGTDTVFISESIEVEENTDYTWYMEDPADINVINDFGETLRIYMDGDYQFDIVDEENRWIIDVSWGEHLLKAYRLSDGSQAASVTIKVTEDEDYTWTIGMPD